MATRFELVLPGENTVALRAAGEEALREIEQLEARLSLYRPGSEIADLNARAAREPVQLTPDLFALLTLAKQLHSETEGAFDITIGPLVRCWGFMGGTGRWPSPEELADARRRVGMHLVELDPETRTVRFMEPGMIVDLGAIGKGYAVDRAVEILKEAGVTSALLHGGTSTIYGLGQPPDAEAWTVGIEDPASHQASPSPAQPASPPSRATLRDQALSVSAIWGRCFEHQGRILGHVLDPRLGQPVTGATMAAVVLPSATETDALSTALLVRGPDGLDPIARLRPNLGALVVTDAEGELKRAARGCLAPQ